MMEFLENIINLINSGNFDTVITEIDEFFEKNPQYKTIDYCHFANPIEEILFDVYVGEIENVKTLNLDEPLEEIYHIYAISKLSMGDVECCEKYLKIANQINPVSSQVLMALCEFYQNQNHEEKIKPYVCDIFKYAYDVELIISNYFKLADYLFHTNKNPELYDHLFNFFLYLKSGDEEKPVRDDIEYFRAHDVPVGINMEIIRILFYLIDVHEKQGMPNAVEYFKNILSEVSQFNEMLLKLERNG